MTESAESMERVAKGPGKGNIVIERTAMPIPAPTEVLVQTRASLISRGSELWRRYILDEPVDPAIMGYSVAGVIQAAGSDVETLRVGERVAALAPHAEYVPMEIEEPRHRPGVVRLPEGVSFEEGTFWPLCTSCVCWAWTAAIEPGDTVAILGQGLVGSLMLQTVRPWGPGKLIAVDALPMRCEMARQLGADLAIDSAEEDPIQQVRQLTSGRGADVVIEAVGGPAGANAFRQGLAMLRPSGRLVLIGLYQSDPLVLDAPSVMNKRILGANQFLHQRAHASRVALHMLATRLIRVREMITHRFHYTRAKEAFDLLYERPGEALGVLLQWPEGDDASTVLP